MLVLLLLACLNFGNAYPTENCDLIKKCSPSATLKYIEPHDEIRSKIIIPGEYQLVSAREVAGIAPRLYNVSMTFHNHTYYTANVTMWIDVYNHTDQITINLNPETLEIDATDFSLVSYCDEKIYVKDNCIKQFLFDRESDSLLMLLDKPLNPELYGLRSPKFSNKAYDNNDNRGKTGLLLSGYDDASALSTQFLTGKVHYVIPCLSHPYLRTNFILSVDVPSGYSFVTSMEIASKCIQDFDKTTKRRMLIFFSLYPVPPNKFGFSLLKGFVSLKDPNLPGRTVWCRSSSKDYLRWMLQAADEAISYFTNTFHWDAATEYLDIVVLFPAPLRNGASLIFVSRIDMENIYERSSNKVELFQDMTSLWIGTRISPKTPEDVCLQEGLTLYFGYRFLAIHDNETVTGYLSKSLEKLRYVVYDSFRTLNVANPEEFDVCQYGIASVFQMISEAFGDTMLETFAAKLINRFDHTGASLDDWEYELVDASQNEARMSGVLTSWYNEPGPLILYVKMTQSHVVITQHLIAGTVKPRPILLKSLVAFTDTTTLHEMDLKQSQEDIEVMSSPLWVIVDPDSQIFAVKVYTLPIYSTLFNHEIYSNSPAITIERLRDIARDFCFAVSKNFFDAPDDYEIHEWKTTVWAMGNVTDDYWCSCCLGVDSPECYNDSDCSKSRLMKTVL